jgi:hypothetical protein
VVMLYTPSSLSALLRKAGFEVVAVRPSREALWSFRMSAAIAKGARPFAATLPLPLRLGLRARAADLRALRRPESAEVMVLSARRG